MKMNFASNKRRSLPTEANTNDKFAVPQDPKKLKAASNQNGIGNTNTNKPLDTYFNDNFSQYFHTQFFQEISKAEMIKSTAKDDLNLTHCGLSQCNDDSQFNESITPGQTRFLPPSSQLLNRKVTQSAQPLRSAASVNKIDAEDDDSNDAIESTEGNHVQCSQIFLKEVSALHTTITSMIDETLMANKLDASNVGDSEENFSVFRSNVTMSEYMQLERSPSAVDAAPLTQYIRAENQVPSEVSHELDDDNELLAAFAMDEDWPKMVLNGKNETNSNAAVVEKKNPRSESYAQAVVKQSPVTAANFYVMGPYFGLPIKVKKLIKEFKGIDDLYDWQKECLQLPAIERKQNLIYALPTSGGKTLVSEILIMREIICRRKNCLLILPYVSIVQEKIWALSPFAVHLDFLVEEYAAGKGCLPPRKRHKKKSVYIATIEKAMALFDSLIAAERANEIGLVVVDELHILGEGSRGAVMESLLTKIQFIKAGIQIVGMSATIGNLKELAQFLDADIYHKDFRPVELTEYIKCGRDLLEIKKDALDIEGAFEHVKTVNFNYKEDVLKMDPDQITGLVAEIIPDNSCLIFCPSKKNCENVATMLCRILSKKYLQYKADEKKNLIEAIENDMGSSICPVLAKTIPRGIAYHHSGLTADERRHLEDAFRQNILCVICCTSTLAAGVNLPAKRVIIRSPYIGREFISLSKYKQMIGRAGRAGYGESGESILICAERDNAKVTQLLCSPMDEACSQMHLNDSRALTALVLSAVGLDLTKTRAELQDLAKHTLMYVQANRSDTNVTKMIDEKITKLIRSKALQVKSTTLDNNTSAELVSIGTQCSPNGTLRLPLTQKTIVLKSSTKLEVSSVGMSSFKSGIDLDKSKIIYASLRQAQRSLVLIDYFHLLYLVTPTDDNNSYHTQPDPSIFYSKYTSLTETQLHTASVIGITESIPLKLMSGRPLKPEVEVDVRRFFVTMVLNELWQLKPVSEVANAYKLDRGLVQNLLGMAAIEASCLLKFCEVLEEFWAFRDLFKNLSERLSYVCSAELVPLMKLPCVKLGRAKQLYAAGYKKVDDVARAKSKELVANIEHMTTRVANQLISAAKVLILEKMENLREEVQECLDVYKS